MDSVPAIHPNTTRAKHMMNATQKETRQRNPEHEWLPCELVGKAWRNDGARVVRDRRRALCQVRTSALASPDNKEAKVPEKHRIDLQSPVVLSPTHP